MPINFMNNKNRGILAVVLLRIIALKFLENSTENVWRSTKRNFGFITVLKSKGGYPLK